MQPALIEGFASGISRLAQAVLQYGIHIRPKAVVCTSDTLSDGELVRQAFQCPVFNRYGNREMSGQLAQNCPDGHSLHINTELCILEVVDNRGKAVAPGQRGKIILTDLTNYAMPFIRYDSGDMAIAGGACSCGRGFPLVSSIEGRSAECLVTPEGHEISPAALGHYLFILCGHIDTFSRFQAEQHKLEGVMFRFVPLKTINEDIKQRLYDDLQHLMGEGVEVDLEFVDDIPPEANGKQMIIKSSI
jgi:Coenzyme F390 synthetase